MSPQVWGPWMYKVLEACVSSLCCPSLWMAAMCGKDCWSQSRSPLHFGLYCDAAWCWLMLGFRTLLEEEVRMEQAVMETSSPLPTPMLSFLLQLMCPVCSSCWDTKEIHLQLTGQWPTWATLSLCVGLTLQISGFQASGPLVLFYFSLFFLRWLYQLRDLVS